MDLRSQSRIIYILIPFSNFSSKARHIFQFGLFLFGGDFIYDYTVFTSLSISFPLSPPILPMSTLASVNVVYIRVFTDNILGLDNLLGFCP